MNFYINFCKGNTNNKSVMPAALSRSEVEEEISRSGDKLHPDYHYVNTAKKLDIVCQHCHEIYQILLCNFRRGSRCPCQQKLNRANVLAKKHEKFIIKMQKIIINNNYELLTDINEYEDSRINNLKFRCYCGYEFITSWNNFKRTKNCMNCSYDNLKLTKEEINTICDDAGLAFIDVTYKNMHQRVNLQCNKCAYKFATTLDSVKNKHTGCRKCKASCGERRIIKVLDKLLENDEIDWYETEFKFANGICNKTKPLIFDFMIIVKGIQAVIEFDGIQHFDSTIEYKKGVNNFKHTRESDLLKIQYCRNNLILFLRISYKEIDKELIKKNIFSFIDTIELFNERNIWLNKKMVYFSNDQLYENIYKTARLRNKELLYTKVKPVTNIDSYQEIDDIVKSAYESYTPRIWKFTSTYTLAQ